MCVYVLIMCECLNALLIGFKYCSYKSFVVVEMRLFKTNLYSSL